MRTCYSLADCGGLQRTYIADQLPSLYHFSFARRQSFQSEIGGSTFFPNVIVNPQTYRVSEPRRLISNFGLFTTRSFHAKSAQLTILPPSIYMKISGVWGIVDVSLHTSSELSKDDSSEIVVVQNFLQFRNFVQKLLLLMTAELGILDVEN
jgi:hypothetical protein